MLRGQEQSQETTKLLDNVVDSLSNHILMARQYDVVTRIRGALALDAKRLDEIAKEMVRLEEPYNRYLALKREQIAHEKSAESLLALIGPHYQGVMTSDKSEAIGENIDWRLSPVLLREETALWEHVAQYLRFVPEARIGEIVDFLGWMQIPTSKQAIESAIRTHAKVFKVKKRGREKYISLK